MLGLRGIALLGTLALAWTAPAWADSQQVSVLTILVEGRVASELTRPLVVRDLSETLSMHPGLRPATGDEQGDTSAVTQRIVDCGADNDCIVERLRGLDARYGLVALVDESASPALLSLQFFDTEARRLLAEDVGPRKAAERSLGDALRARTRTLLERAGFRLGGRLVVDLQPTRAAPIVLAGPTEVGPDEPAGTSFTLAPGRYLLRASADGHESGELVVEVVAGREARVALNLIESASLTSSPWFWTAIGVIAAAGGTTAVLLATRSTERCVCLTINGQGCGCPP